MGVGACDNLSYWTKSRCSKVYVFEILAPKLRQMYQSVEIIEADPLVSSTWNNVETVDTVFCHFSIQFLKVKALAICGKIHTALENIFKQYCPKNS